jgi:hypothetical protein
MVRNFLWASTDNHVHCPNRFNFVYVMEMAQNIKRREQCVQDGNKLFRGKPGSDLRKSAIKSSVLCQHERITSETTRGTLALVYFDKHDRDRLEILHDVKLFRVKLLNDSFREHAAQQVVEKVVFQPKEPALGSQSPLRDVVQTLSLLQLSDRKRRLSINQDSQEAGRNMHENNSVYSYQTLETK